MTRSGTGYTLIELLIVVAIIAIVAAVAIPSYEAYGRKGRQENLKAQILEIAAAQERHFTVRGRYAADMPDLAPFGLPAGGQQADTGWQIGDYLFLTGVVIRQESGQGFWVIGKGNIDGADESLGECWGYFGRGIKRPQGAHDDLAWLYDDAGNQSKEVVTGFPPSEVCTLTP